VSGTARGPRRLVLVGFGAIGRTVAQLLQGVSGIELVAVAVRDPMMPRPGLSESVELIDDPVALARLAPEIVAEAAGRDSVGPWGLAALGCGADFVVSSVSALADDDLLEVLRAAAVEGGGRLEVQPGALGGVDALSGARLMGIDEVEHRIVKPPQAWRGTPAEERCDLDRLVEATVFYSASARETASAFPKNANVAMTTALAGIGADRTMVTLVADPAAATNRHEIEASGAFGRLSVVIANNPLPANPKSSAMAALNLARVIQRRVSPVIV